MNRINFTPERNCWRVAKAESFGLIIDGESYFRALREALLKAERLVILVGWDFDFEIEMLPGEGDADGNAPDGFPNQIGPFLDSLVDSRPDLEIYLLKWSGGALIAPGRLMPTAKIKLLSPDQIHLGFDGCHPIGASHHQKIVVVDDSLAFCGGVDVTDGRWDRRDHAPDDPLRRLKDGEIAQPWHDATSVISGEAAAELSRLCRMRWERAQGAEMDEAFTPGFNRWPDSIKPDFRDVDIAIARTEPPTRKHPIINEIETLYLDSIAAAKDCIYLESQYFSSDEIAQAIMARLQEPDGPEVVVINPLAAQMMVEDEAMHVTRSRFIRMLSAADPHDRFRIFYPADSSGSGIYVHAKLSFIDNNMLRVGSSNIDRRSMGFDTECDVALSAGDTDEQQVIRGIRDGLIAEHLGRDPQQVSDEIDRQGSVIAAIEALNPPTGRGLRPILPRKESLLGALLADTRFFDPRYRSSAVARLGITSRHVMYGAAALAVGAVLWSRRRRRR